MRQRLAVQLFLAVVLIAAFEAIASAEDSVPVIRTANIGKGIQLHYVEEGHGVPVVFVHGSISDGGYWSDQVGPFAKHYRAIAYSRRYNYPNNNPPRPGYSAIADANDLAAFIRTLHLGKVVVVGRSYGALTALFFAARYPGLARALVLAEPPAVSLLQDLHDPDAQQGKEMFEDIQRRMVQPMQQEFRAGNDDAGVATFIDYVFNDPHAWAKMSNQAKQQTLRDVKEWEVMMTSGTLFPVVKPSTIRKINVPVLLLSGAKSYPFLALITRELSHDLPHSQSIIFPNAGHQMWYQDADECRDDVERFLAANGIR